MAWAPGGGSLAFTVQSLQIIVLNLTQSSFRSGRRRGCVDRQGMNVGLKQVVDGGIDQAMASHRCHAAKGLRDNPYAKMALASLRPGMAGVQVALVLNDQDFGRKTTFEQLAQALRSNGPGGTHASAPFDSAVLVLPLSHRTCGTMNISMATVMPNTLKLTHTLSAKFQAT